MATMSRRCETQDGADVGANFEEADRRQQHEHRQRRDEGRNKHVAEWIVDLRPHAFSSPHSSFLEVERSHWSNNYTKTILRSKCLRGEPPRWRLPARIGVLCADADFCSRSCAESPPEEGRAHGGHTYAEDRRRHRLASRDVDPRGRLRPGEKLAPERDLAVKLDVSAPRCAKRSTGSRTRDCSRPHAAGPSSRNSSPPVDEAARDLVPRQP